MNNYLAKQTASLQARLTSFDGSHPVADIVLPLDGASGRTGLAFAGGDWSLDWSFADSVDHTGGTEVRLHLNLLGGLPPPVNLSMEWVFDRWSTDNWVFMPAAVYGGNRYPSRKLPYPPMLTEPGDRKLQTPVLSDVPRLNNGPGKSRIQLLAGDLATPALGFHDPRSARAFLLLCGQGTAQGDYGLEIRENDARNQAVLCISLPGVRHDRRYTICDREHVSTDRGWQAKEGGSLEIVARIETFFSPDLPSFFRRFVSFRKNSLLVSRPHQEFPFSSAFDLQERKYNRDNWVEEAGYYSVGMREVLSQNWQLGWVGGIGTYSLLLYGSELTRARSVRNLEFIFRDDGVTGLGFFYPLGDGREFFHDMHEVALLRRQPAIDTWDLIRKQGDALYYLVKQFMLLEKLGSGNLIRHDWRAKLQGCADALAGLWQRNGQLGFYMDGATGDIAVGGSTSGGIVPAGLALAARCFGRPEYLEIAKQIAANYHREFLLFGFTNGGPGEATLCPDSESAAALLTSLTELYDQTGEQHWLAKAADLAALCASWVVSYDFRFPAESTFGRLDQRTTGTVWANIQNKHSAPGICTHSGLALLKLYRASGDQVWLNLIQDIAHAITPYLSRTDRPILAAGTPFLGTGTVGGENTSAADRRPMPDGWMSERVNMSDWLEPVGEIFYGSCWCEVSCLLTVAEIPGLYVDLDSGLVCALDHIEARMPERTKDGLRIAIRNPTRFPARVTILAENAARRQKPLGEAYLLDCPEISLQAGEEKDLMLQ